MRPSLRHKPRHVVVGALTNVKVSLHEHALTEVMEISREQESSKLEALAARHNKGSRGAVSCLLPAASCHTSVTVM